MRNSGNPNRAEGDIRGDLALEGVVDELIGAVEALITANQRIINATNTLTGIVRDRQVRR